jgi:Predicted permeases
VELTLWVMLFLLGAAFLAGFIDSIAGGGGLISLPALLVAGVPPHMALGSGKLMSTLGTVVSLTLYARSKAVDWGVIVRGTAFALGGAYLGSVAALHVNPDVLGKIVVFILPVIAAIVLSPRRKNHAPKELSPLSSLFRIVLVCTSVGFYDGFLGPGAGSFLLIGLHIFLGLGLVAASGTAKAFNLASNFGSLVAFLINGKVLFAVGLPMAIANIAGNVLGSRLAIRQGPELVRKVLFVSLGLLLVTLLWRYYG